MTSKPLKYCCGCNQELPRTSEFFYLKKKTDRFVASARCKPCSIKKATDRYFSSDKYRAVEARRCEAKQRRQAEIIAKKRRADGRLDRAREKVLPPARLREGMRARLSHYRSRAGGLHPDVTTDTAAGCSWSELVRHIEAQWYDGMSWSNYGSWHIDHIEPISAVDLNDRDAALHVFNFQNLQPLWAHENVKKGARRKEKS